MHSLSDKHRAALQGADVRGENGRRVQYEYQEKISKKKRKKKKKKRKNSRKKKRKKSFVSQAFGLDLHLSSVPFKEGRKLPPFFEKISN